MEKQRKLKNLEIEEISVVESAANRRKFFIKKEQIMEKLIELLKGMFGEALTEADIEKAKELSDESVEAISGALSVIKSWEGELYPEDLTAAQLILLKHGGWDRNVEKTELTDEDFATYLIENIEKVGASLSKATRVQIERIKEICVKMLEGKEKNQKKDDEVEKLSTETLDKLDELDRLKKAEAERIKKETSEKSQEDIKTLIKDSIDEALKPILKEKGITKKLKGQEEEEVKKEGEVEDMLPSWKPFG